MADTVIKILAYPTVGLILGVFFICRFSEEFRGLLRRTKKAGPFELGGEQQKGLEAVETPSTLSKRDDLMRTFDSPMLLSFEESVRRDLKEKGDPEPQKQIDALVRHLAAAQVALHLERLSRFIYGSQLSLLVYLNSQAQGETAEALKRFYDEASVSSPQLYQRYSYPEYLAFLKNSHLVTEQNGRLYVTEVAKSLMMYMVRTGDTAPRPH